MCYNFLFQGLYPRNMNILSPPSLRKLFLKLRHLVL